MIELKFAEEADLPAIVDLCKQLHERSYHSRFIPFDEKSTYILAKEMLNSKKSNVIFCLKVESTVVAVLAGKVTQQLFNISERTALELVFFILPLYNNFHSKKLLYGAFKQWAKLVGCQTIMMGRIREPGKQEEYFLKRIR